MSASKWGSSIVSAFFLLAFMLRKCAFYQPVKLQLGSAVISVMAVGWIVQRMSM